LKKTVGKKDREASVREQNKVDVGATRFC